MSEIQAITSPIQSADMPTGIAPELPIVDSGFDPGLLDWTMGAMQVAPRALAPAIPVMPQGDPLAQWLEQTSGISADFAPPASTLPADLEAMIAPAPGPVADVVEMSLSAPVAAPAMVVEIVGLPDADQTEARAPDVPVNMAEMSDMPLPVAQNVAPATHPQPVAAPATPSAPEAPVPAAPIPVAPEQAAPVQGQPARTPQMPTAPVQVPAAATPQNAPTPPAKDQPAVPAETPPSHTPEVQSKESAPADRPQIVMDATTAPPRPLPQATRDALAVPDQMPMPDVQSPQPLRDAAPVTPTAQSHAPAPHADPRPVMQQVTSAVVTTRKNVTEIALAPEELGRLRLVMSGPDRSHVTIWAERPETLDLVRRNADILTQHLQEAGIETSDMEFRQDSSGPWGDSDTNSAMPDRDDADIAVTTRVQVAATPVSDRRLDIRL